jgi:hypothetical protein
MDDGKGAAMDVRVKGLLEFLVAGTLFAAGIYGYMWYQKAGGGWADRPCVMYLLALPGGAALAGLFHSSADPYRRVRVQRGPASAARRDLNTSGVCGLMNNATSSG